MVLQYVKNAFSRLKTTARTDPAMILLHVGTATGLMGFTMTDPLPLRTCSIVSSVSSVIYMLSRPVPLMTPIYWSALFISVNMYKIAGILYSRVGVELSDLEEEVYMRHFVHSGMRPRQFLTLVSNAKSVEYAPGTIVEGEVKFPSVDTVKLLMKGSAVVLNEGVEMYTVDAKKPICFLGDLSALHTAHSNNNSDPGVQELVPDFVAAVYAQKEPVLTLEWDQDYIVDTLNSNNELGQRLRTVLTSSVMQKVFNVGVSSHSSRYLSLLSAFAVDGQISSMEKKVLREYVRDHGIDRATQERGLRDIGWTEEEFQQGHKDTMGDYKWDAMKNKLAGFLSSSQKKFPADSDLLLKSRDNVGKVSTPAATAPTPVAAGAEPVSPSVSKPHPKANVSTDTARGPVAALIEAPLPVAECPEKPAPQVKAKPSKVKSGTIRTSEIKEAMRKERAKENSLDPVPSQD